MNFSARSLGFRCLLLMAVIAVPAPGLGDGQMAPPSDPDGQIEALTLDVLRLQRDWLELRDWPSESPERRIEVYLTTTLPPEASVYSMRLTLNGEQTATHSYSGDQLDALRNGGAHRVYLGALNPGSHLLSAEIRGDNGMGNNYRSETRLSFRKLATSKLIELHVLALQPGERPDIVVRQWD